MELVKHKDSPQIYIVDGGRKYPIQGIEEFNALGLDMSQVKIVESSWLNGIDLGGYITPSNVQTYVSKFGKATPSEPSEQLTEADKVAQLQEEMRGVAGEYGYPFDPNVPTIKYPEELQELEGEVNTAKQRLLQDYNQYLQDIETGKIRAGTDQQKQLERTLQEKMEYVQQQDFNIQRNRETLNRSWIQRGGLFSGVRGEAVQQYMTEEDMARQRYTSQWGYGQEQQQTAYNRAMEDYSRRAQLAGTQYTQGTENIALQRIKDIRSLQQAYQQAIVGSATSELERKWG